MARYQEIAADLRTRIRAGEFPIGSRLPGISALQAEYDVAGLNTIRAAQQAMVEEGLLLTRQGVGVFVVALEPLARPPDVLAELRAARNALTRVIAAIEKGTSPIDPLHANRDLEDLRRVATGDEDGDAPGPGSSPGSGAGTARASSEAIAVTASSEREAIDDARSVEHTASSPPSTATAAPSVRGTAPAKRTRQRWHLVEAGDEDDHAAPVVIISSHASESAARNAQARQARKAAAGIVLEVLRDQDISAYIEWDAAAGRGVVRPGPPARGPGRATSAAT